MTRPHWTLAGAVVLLMAAGPGCKDTTPIRIGTIVPLSGPDAPIGTAMRDAMTLAVDQANQRGGIHGRKIELVVLDDSFDHDKAVAAAKKLTDDPSVLGA